MNADPEERYDRITRLAHEVFQVDHAVVNLVDSTSIFTKSQPEGGTFRHTPPDDSFCQVAVRQSGILEVQDALADERFAHRAIVTEHGIRFYAGFPIRSVTGDTVATLCLLDSEPRVLSDTERALLTRMGEWTEAEIRADDVRSHDPDEASAGSPHEEAPKAGPVRDLVDADEVSIASLAIPFGVVSGDRSAWQQAGERVIVTLTDVMGKGERQGALAERIVGALHRVPGDGPLDAVRRTEAELTAANALEDTFATLFHAVIDTGSGAVGYVDAGHGLTLHIAADGTTTRLSSHNLPLGLRPDDLEWEPGALRVAPGDVLVSVSDGVLEAYDSTLDSLRMLAAELRDAPAAGAFLDRLSVRVSEHLVDDDVTAVVVSIR
ncbi:SpoIIE family protein phosphatase [Herbiconiux sp. YIM B11900]|uniref:SpoIIE family protein phosphatase n=1 Tax=Herbiconiux sp. YIM B11900 TaxID=3404131 RepID=UPI003F874C3A